eukprot:COSAG05_NODE_9275_length_635_cov_1.041045_2_plen_55_part_01
MPNTLEYDLEPSTGLNTAEQGSGSGSGSGSGAGTDTAVQLSDVANAPLCPHVYVT